MEFTGFTEHLERFFDRLRVECTKVLWHGLRMFKIQSGGNSPNDEQDPVLVRWIGYAFGIGGLGFFVSLLLIIVWVIVSGKTVDDVPEFAGQVNFFFLYVMGVSLALMFAVILAIPIFYALVWLLHLINKPKKGTVGTIALGLAIVGWVLSN